LATYFYRSGFPLAGSSSTFRALRHRNYRLWFYGQGISLIGTWMQNMAQQVLVYRLTGSAAALGIISVIGLIPMLPLSLWGGSISDRFNKRNVILLMQVAMLVEAFILAFLTWTGKIQVWHVYLLSFILAGVNAIDMPARQAFTVDLIAGKEDLTNAIGLNSAMFNGARAIGPSLAGITVAATGEGPAFLLNGLSFVAVIISLLMMRNLPQSSKSEQGVYGFDHMAGGFRFTAKNQSVAVLISLVAVSAFLSMPYSTLMPVYAKNILYESGSPIVRAVCYGNHPIIKCQSPEALLLGILMTAVGIGALIGALFVASLTNQRRGVLLTLGNLAFPAFLFVMAVSRSFLISTLMLLLIGISFVLQNALANTLLQLATPDEVRGRVMGVYTMTFQSSMRLGGLQAGVMADWVSAQFSLGIGAVISLIFGIYIAVRYPKVRRM
jgi:MFS family permease